MQSLEYLQGLFIKELERQNFEKEPQELYKPISYTMGLGGKRLRPVMLLMACDLFGGELNKAIKPAIGLELFHNFTLLHDDIMDKAPLRRGKPSVYKKWNTNTAILSGDTMFAIAYSYVAETEKNLLPDVLKVFTQTATEVCEGQQYDLNYEKFHRLAVEDYLTMIHLKTAVLFGASLKIGAIIGGAAQKDAELLYNFGEQIGMAFQLRDDLLDAFGNEDIFGKKTGGDILVNKKTYLLIKAYEKASKSQAMELDRLMCEKNISDSDKIKGVTSIYNDLNIKRLTEEKMEAYYSKALTFLGQVNIKEDQKTELNKLGSSLMKRAF